MKTFDMATLGENHAIPPTRLETYTDEKVFYANIREIGFLYRFIFSFFFALYFHKYTVSDMKRIKSNGWIFKFRITLKLTSTLNHIK